MTLYSTLQTLYLVKWLGWDREEDLTWEPLEHLQDPDGNTPANRVNFSKINIFCYKNVDFTEHQFRVKIRLKDKMLISLNINLELKSVLSTKC